MTAAKHKGGDDEDGSQWRAIFYCGGQNIGNLKSVHVLPCRRSKGFYGNTSFDTQTIHICLIRRKLKVVSDTKLKAIRDVFSKEAEPKESLKRAGPSLGDIV